MAIKVQGTTVIDDNQGLRITGVSTFTNGPVFIGAATSTGTASQRLQITGGAYISTSTGIGTTNPLVPLHVLGNFLVAAGTSTGQHITQKAYELNSGTLSWEGTAGQLFSITNNLTSGSIFSVNDVSGIPSVDVNADGTVTLAPYADGNVGIATTRPTSRLHVVGDALITGIATVNSNLVVNGNTLYADATNNRVGIGTTNPLSILQVQSPSAFTTFGNLVPNGLYVNNPSSGFTYPTTASFEIHPGILNNLTLDTSQTINSSTPGGFNFVYPLRNRISITTATTSTDLTRLYINALDSLVSWASTAPTTQIIGLNDDITFGGSSISVAACNGTFTLAGISSSTQTATTINSSGLFVFNATTTNRIRNVTTWRGYNANLNIGQGTGAGNTTTITTAEYFTNTGSNTIQAGGTGSSTLITNLYGLRLGTPSISGIVTITNNWGIYQEWSSQSNYFSGNTLIGSATSTGTVSQPLQVTGGGYFSGSVGIGTTIPTGGLTIATVGSATTGASQIYLNGATSNRIDFNINGVAVPAAGRSAGTKIVLYPSLTGGIEYAIGVEPNYIWQSVPAGSTAGFKWYGGTTELAVLKGDGNLGVGITNPGAKLDVIGNVKISSDLNVSGVSTFAGITTSTSSLFANNLSVSGISTFAGIATHTASLFGTQASFTGVSTSGGFNATTGNTYQIAGTTVLNNNTLGSGVVNSSLTSVGTLGQLNVSGVSTFAGITTVTGSTLFSRQISASGVSTFAGIATHTASLFGTTASFTGVSTSGGFNATTGNTYQIAGTTVLSNNTLGSGVVNSSLTSVGTLGQLSVSGVSTFAGIATHTASLFGTQASFTGVSTFAGIATHTASLFGTQASFTGVSTFNNTLNVVPTSTSIAGLFSGTTSSDMVRITQLGTGNALVVEDSANPDSSPFVVGAGGSVGVGTTNPQYIFTVTDTGTPATTGLTNCLADFTTTANSYGQINLRNTSTGTNASADVIITANNGTDSTNFIDLGINNSGYSVGSWTINGANDGYLYTSDGNLSIGAINASVAKYISFFTGGTLISNERMRINSTGVGIGTTNPGATLNVVPTSTSIAGLFSGTTSSDMVRITQLGTGNAFVVEDEANPDSTPFVIHSAGPVGAGTTSPGAQFHVVPTSSSIAGLFSGTTSSDMVRITQLGSGNALVVEDSANPDATPFVVNAAGSVGIGTTNPNYALEVRGGIGATTLVVTGVSTFSNGPVFIGAATSTGTSSQPLQVTGGAYISGNLGIGTTLATYPLDIYQSTNSQSVLRLLNPNTGSNASSELIASTGPTGNISAVFGMGGVNRSTYGPIGASKAYIYANGSGGIGIGADNASGVITFGTGSGSSERGRFTANGELLIGAATSTGTASQPLQVTGGAYVSGSVGIGTTNPLGRLHVGAASTQSVVVTSTGSVSVGHTSPSFAVDVSGDARVQSTGKMRFGGTAGTTNFYIQYNSTANSLDFVAG